MFLVASGSLQTAAFISVAAMTVALVTIVIKRNLGNRRQSSSQNSVKVNQRLALHGQAAFQLALASFPCRDQFARDVWDWLSRERASAGQCHLHPAIIRVLQDAALAIYDEEVPQTLPRFVEPGAHGYPGYESKIKAIVIKCSNPEGYYGLLVKAVGESFLDFEVLISQRLGHVSLKGPFLAPLSHLVKDLPAILHGSFVEPYRTRRTRDVPEYESVDGPKEIARSCRFGASLATLRQARVSFSPPDWARLGHHWIIAQDAKRRQGLLSALLAADIDRVLRKEASIVVIDSSGDLTRDISRLKIFARGQPLHGKLTLIEPNGVDPLAFSLFRGLRAAPNTHQKNLHRELAQFALTSLFGPNLSRRQSTIIGHAAELLLVLPRPSLSALQDMLRLPERFEAHFHKLSPAARDFFKRGHGGREDTTSARADLLARLENALSDPQFCALFSHAEDRFDLGDQINRSKVVIINPAQLSAYAEPFARVFIAVALMALSRRSAPEIFPAPTFFYVEDFGRCFAHARDVSRLLDFASANNIGLVFGTGSVARFSANLREAFADVSIITACGVNADDANFLAPKMSISAQDLFSLAREDCLISIQGQNKGLGPLTARALKRRPERMSDAEFTDLRTEMQHRYTIRPRQPQDAKYDLRWAATISPRTAERGGKLKVDNLLLTIIAGTTDGTVLRLKGKGVPKPDRTRGNLYITVNVPQLPAKRSMQA